MTDAKNTTLVLLLAGQSNRFRQNTQTKKQWLRIHNTPLWQYLLNRLTKKITYTKIILVAHEDEINYINKHLPISNNNICVLSGGNTRAGSVQNALKATTTKHIMITDVARANVPIKVIKKILKNKDKASCIIPTLSINDSIYYQDKYINRDDLKIIQTPQLCDVKLLKKALKNDTTFTDDGSAILSVGGDIKFIKGSKKSHKITTTDDLKLLKLSKPSSDTFIGYGYDVHELEIKNDKKFILGGVHFSEVKVSLKAHSDGDVLIHSIIDSLLGAIGAGDIGEFFPDTDMKYKNIKSTILLKHIVEFICNIGYQITNIDTTIVCEKIKISPYKRKIQEELSKIINIPLININIKATTNEKMGFVGRQEGIAVKSISKLCHNCNN